MQQYQCTIMTIFRDKTMMRHTAEIMILLIR